MTRLFFLLLLIASTTQAQQKTTAKRIARPSPVGAFAMSHEHDPQGNAALFVLENNRYVIVYFGGAEVGSWKKVRDSFVVFFPYTAPAPYELYGHYNPALKDSLRIYLTGFTNDACYMAFNVVDTTVPVLQRVSDPSSNCRTYHNVYHFASGATTLSFAHQSYPAYGEVATKSDLYTFTNGAGYNDFIAYHYSSKHDNHAFFALWSKQQLYFNHFPEEYFGAAYKNRLPAILAGKTRFWYDKTNGNRRGALPNKGEDAALIRGLGAEIVVPDTVFYNPFYKELPMDSRTLQQEYTYHPQKAAYLDKEYIEGEENGDAYKNYNSDNLIYLFKRLPTVTTKATGFSTNEKPLFNYICDKAVNKPAP